MNASLLAALASPTGKTPAPKAASKPKSAESAIAAASKSNKENLRRQAVSSAAKADDAKGFSLAPSFTVTEAPSAPGRMENLRVLIEEGKKAAAEGRLAAALRKYETAMVTLPEAYKPRLRKKIAKLEARLDLEEDRSPGTPSCSSKSAFLSGVDTLEKDPGLLDLLHIAVQDVTAAADGSGRDSGPLSTFSPRRSSPLVRELGGYGRVISSVSDAGEPSTPPLVEEQGGEEEDDDDEPQQQQQQHDDDDDEDDDDANHGDVTDLEDGLASRLVMTLGSAASGGHQDSSSPRGAERRREGRRFAAEGAEVSTGEEASLSSGKGEEDEPFGLGAAVVGADDGGCDVDLEGADKQERTRAINRGMSDKLEKQVVAVMNEASSQELTELHGIGLRRAQLIIQTRTAAPFETLADLSRIGMYPKQIEKMGRHNMLECLDVYPTKTGSP